MRWPKATLPTRSGGWRSLPIIVINGFSFTT